jgi:nicotinamidase-related amidase
MPASELPGALLLCVDMQAPFLAPMPERDTIVRRCRFTVAAARALGLRTAFTEQVPQKLGPTLPELLGLVEQPIQLGKSTFSALADDGIRETIQGLDTEHLLLCGIETPICVYQTAIAALNANLQVTVLSDAVGARRPDDARVALDALARAGVHVLPAESVFYSLLHDTRHPAFKRFTELVKSHV